MEVFLLIISLSLIALGILIGLRREEDRKNLRQEYKKYRYVLLTALFVAIISAGRFILLYYHLIPFEHMPLFVFIYLIVSLIAIIALLASILKTVKKMREKSQKG